MCSASVCYMSYGVCPITRVMVYFVIIIPLSFRSGSLRSPSPRAQANPSRSRTSRWPLPRLMKSGSRSFSAYFDLCFFCFHRFRGLGPAIKTERADHVIDFSLLFLRYSSHILCSFVRPCFHGGLTTFVSIVQLGVMNPGDHDCDPAKKKMDSGIFDTSDPLNY